jgi:hypothetical protein
LLPLEQMQSEIAALNKDYSATNPDKSIIPAVWTGHAKGIEPAEPALCGGFGVPLSCGRRESAAFRVPNKLLRG